MRKKKKRVTRNSMIIRKIRVYGMITNKEREEEGEMWRNEI